MDPTRVDADKDPTPAAQAEPAATPAPPAAQDGRRVEDQRGAEGLPARLPAAPAVPGAGAHPDPEGGQRQADRRHPEAAEPDEDARQPAPAGVGGAGLRPGRPVGPQP